MKKLLLILSFCFLSAFQAQGTAEEAKNVKLRHKLECLVGILNFPVAIPAVIIDHLLLKYGFRDPKETATLEMLHASRVCAAGTVLVASILAPYVMHKLMQEILHRQFESAEIGIQLLMQCS